MYDEQQPLRDIAFYGQRNLVVLGSCRAGKTQLCVRFTNDRFSDVYEPTYENSFRKTIHHEGRDIDCVIKDTQGLVSDAS
jgi:GTPase SAR1 family protein